MFLIRNTLNHKNTHTKMHQFLRLDPMQHSSSFEKKKIYTPKTSAAHFMTTCNGLLSHKKKKNDFYLS